MPRRRDQQTRVVSDLAEIRVAREVTQHELARAAGISLSTLQRLEKHRVPKPPLWWFVNCAIVLGVELEDILEPIHRGWTSVPSAPKPPAPGWLERLQAERG